MALLGPPGGAVTAAAVTDLSIAIPSPGNDSCTIHLRVWPIRVIHVMTAVTTAKGERAK